MLAAFLEDGAVSDAWNRLCSNLDCGHRATQYWAGLHPNTGSADLLIDLSQEFKQGRCHCKLNQWEDVRKDEGAVDVVTLLGLPVKSAGCARNRRDCMGSRCPCRPWCDWSHKVCVQVQHVFD